MVRFTALIHPPMTYNQNDTLSQNWVSIVFVFNHRKPHVKESNVNYWVDIYYIWCNENLKSEMVIPWKQLTRATSLIPWSVFINFCFPVHTSYVCLFVFFLGGGGGDGVSLLDIWSSFLDWSIMWTMWSMMRNMVVREWMIHFGLLRFWCSRL